MLRAILESAVSAIIAIDEHGIVRSVNPATEKMFGYSADEILGENIKMLMPDPYRGEHDGYIDRHVKTGTKRIIGIGREVQGRRKDGSIFPLHLAVGEFAVDGQRYFSGILNDLSAREELQEKVDRQSLLIRTVFDHVPEALVISSADGKIILVNQAATAILGYSLEEAIGLPWTQLFSDGAELTRVESDFSKFRESEPNTVLSVHLRRKNGSTFPAEINIAEMIDYDTARSVRVSLFRDVTEILKQKAATVKLQRLEAIGQLTGGIAHDFNNLLTVISGNLELLEEQLVSPQDREILSRAARAADSGSRLTNRLLTFARKKNLASEVINLNDHVQAMIELLRRALGDSIELRTKLSPDLWLVRADAGEVEAAVLNLAINARDAMPNGGILSIRTDNIVFENEETGYEDPLRAGPYVQISVSDNGLGMTKDVVSRVFEPFFTTKPSGRGTGLGLSTIYGFIKQSNGNITIDSEPGSGTVVKLFLPRCEETQAAIGAATKAPAHHSKGERILVVEDNRDVRQLTVGRVKRLAYQAIECVTGAEAKEALENGLEVSVVLTDIMMPGGVSGVDLASWIAINMPEIQVILTTGFADGAAETAEAGRPWPILRKPYTQMELARVLRAAIKDRTTP